MTDPIVVGSETKFVFSADTIPRQLSKIVGAGSPHSLELDGVDYIVPAGKVFWIYRMIIGFRFLTGTVPAFNYYYGPNPDSIVGATKFTDLATGEAQAVRTMPLTIEFIRKIDAGNYINVNNPYGAELWLNIFGIECDV